MAKLTIDLPNLDIPDYTVRLPNATLEGVRLLMAYYGFAGDDASIGPYFANRLIEHLKEDHLQALNFMTLQKMSDQNKQLVDIGFSQSEG